MNLKKLTLFMLGLSLVSTNVAAFDTSIQALNQSCKEFKELMTAGNKLVFLRSDLARNNSTWKAHICLQCTPAKESSLVRVTSMENGAVDWRFPSNNFLAIDEIINTEDDSKKDIVSIHSLLNSVKKTCKAYLNPINEGSHLQLTERESCVRHEYFRLYLKRKYSLSESNYLDFETKKDLSPNDFSKSCQETLLAASEENILTRAFSTAFISVKKVLGIGLGEYEPVVSKDSKSFYREIATDKKSK